jgi:hypothetical protein
VWDSVRPVLGYVLVGLGLLLITIGWYKTSGESVVAKQLPYLVSGGLFGLGFLVLGARFLLIEDLRRDSGRLDRLETMVGELHAVLLSQVSVLDVTDAGAKDARRSTELTVVTPATSAARRPRAARG